MIHYSLDDPKLELLKSLPGKKILVYHNITPPEFFQKENPEKNKKTRYFVKTNPNLYKPKMSIQPKVSKPQETKNMDDNLNYYRN